MNETTNPVLNPRPVPPSPGDVDGVLRAFFQAELPSAFRLPIFDCRFSIADPLENQQSKISNRKSAIEGGLRHRAVTLVRSRWALAATILLLLFGHTLLSRVFPEMAPADSDPTATPSIGKGPERMNKPTPNRTRPPMPPADHSAQP